MESYDAHRSLPLTLVGLRVSQVAPIGARSFVLINVPFVSVYAGRVVALPLGFTEYHSQSHSTTTGLSTCHSSHRHWACESVGRSRHRVRIALGTT